MSVCAISLYLEHEPCGAFDFELDAAFPSFERGCLRVRGLTRGSSRELPRNMQGKQVLLLAPVVSYSVGALRRERATDRVFVGVLVPAPVALGWLQALFFVVENMVLVDFDGWWGNGRESPDV